MGGGDLPSNFSLTLNLFNMAPRNRIRLLLTRPPATQATVQWCCQLLQSVVKSRAEFYFVQRFAQRKDCETTHVTLCNSPATCLATALRDKEEKGKLGRRKEERKKKLASNDQYGSETIELLVVWLSLTFRPLKKPPATPTNKNVIRGTWTIWSLRGGVEDLRKKLLQSLYSQKNHATRMDIKKMHAQL